MSKVKAGKDWGAAEIEGGEQVDNLEAGGFFAHYGREPTARPRPDRAHPSVSCASKAHDL